MDVMTMRFIVIFFMILIGMLVIPFTYFYLLQRKYGNRAPWYLLLPVLAVYLYLFFNYANLLIPERWTLKPVEVYHCEWKTNYIPKYPIN